jgi:orotidine-5'-phosphate decarboxylase
MASVQAKNSALIVGLDPDVRYLPETLLESAFKRYGHGERALANAVALFNEAIIKKVSDLVPAVKPQLAYYEALGPAGLAAYRRTVETAKAHGLLVIADAKRADIGATSEAYARAFFGPEAGEGKREPRWVADALTVQPYLGRDGLEPLLRRCQDDRGLFVLVHKLLLNCFWMGTGLPEI